MVIRLDRVAGFDMLSPVSDWKALSGAVVFLMSLMLALGYSGTSTMEGKGARLHKESIFNRLFAISSKNRCQKLMSHMLTILLCAISLLSEYPGVRASNGILNLMPLFLIYGFLSMLFIVLKPLSRNNSPKSS